MRIKNYLVRKKQKRVFGKLKLQTPKIIWIDEFICLRSKASSSICNGENTNKRKGIRESYSKIINFEVYKKCSDGEKHQGECGDYFLISVSHEIYLQK